MARLHAEIERIALGDLMGEGGKRTAIRAAVTRLKRNLPDIELPESAADNQPDAQRFLEELCQRAGLMDVLDGAWWMSFADMLHEGWRIVPPPEEENGGSPAD